MKFSLIIPLWNESASVPKLIRAIEESKLPQIGMKELILVNNASGDNTGTLIDEAAKSHPWIVPIHLEQNQNYGGGVYEGFKYARCDIFCYIPGDLQVMPEDVLKVYHAFLSNLTSKNKLLVKGYRTIRHDPMQTKLISKCYTFLANQLLHLHIKDVNGLPKMFHRNLMDLIPAERAKTFVFDIQILAIARTHGWIIEEVPVTFHDRREGKSSWSQKRLQVYWQTFWQTLKVRSLRYKPGIPLKNLR
ncbi:MAG: glycosyltransferase family 2 protein [Gammaproteobacteria bacterium]|nr:glycosyltransferase family 2 protein [Gammaproteobacteria bacterium]